MGNLIFSRRCLQSRLYELGEVLPHESVQKLVDRLNSPGRDRLAAMWEVAWLAALARTRPIAHEQMLPDGARPDFSFEVVVDGAPTLVIGDITSASDKGLNDRNPVGAFWKEVVRLVYKHGLNPGNFSYHVDHQMVGRYLDSRADLLLPPMKELHAYLKRNVEPFIISLKETGQATGKLVCKEHGVSFSIGYNTAQQYSGGGHISYAVPYSATKTPIFNALEKKASQLSAAPNEAVRVVILCDAGCHAMMPTKFTGGGSLTAAEVTREYLRRSTSVDLVVLVTIVTDNPTDVWRKVRRVDATFVTPGAPRERSWSTAAAAAVREVIAQALPCLPLPKIDATNAAIRMDYKHYGNALHGGSGMNSGRSGVSVRVSARAVLELLAGQLKYDEFQRMHRWNHRDVGPFVRFLSKGSLITRAELIDGGDADDDWLELHFGEPDPAVTPFRVTPPGSGKISEPSSDEE